MKNKVNDAAYIGVRAGVRYWEDATVNGKEDSDGTLIPLRDGDYWSPIIRIEDGFVVDWPAGVTADIHFKVCDDGEYWILDSSRKAIAKWSGFYVPNDFLSPSENGYGDYIIMKIKDDGFIEGWEKPTVRSVCGCDEDQSGWLELPASHSA